MQKRLKKKLVKKLLPQALAKKLLEQMRRRDADFIVVSFPRSGRTWLRCMLSFYLSNRYDEPVDKLFRFDTLTEENDAVPKIHFTHDDRYKGPAQQLSRDKSFYYSKRILFVIRDPRDIVISLYFHRIYREKDYHGSLQDLVFGEQGGLETLIEFYNIWAESFKHVSNCMLLRYEDMHHDPEIQLERVLHFFGVSTQKEEISHAVKESCFSRMQDYEFRDAFSTADLRPGYAAMEESFKVRRGKVGGYRDYISEGEIERVNGMIADKLNPFYGY